MAGGNNPAQVAQPTGMPYGAAPGMGHDPAAYQAMVKRNTEQAQARGPVDMSVMTDAHNAGGFVGGGQPQGTPSSGALGQISGMLGSGGQFPQQSSQAGAESSQFSQPVNIYDQSASAYSGALGR